MEPLGDDNRVADPEDPRARTIVAQVSNPAWSSKTSRGGTPSATSAARIVPGSSYAQLWWSPETSTLSTLPACHNRDACSTRSASIVLIEPSGLTSAPGTIATSARGTSATSAVESPPALSST